MKTAIALAPLLLLGAAIPPAQYRGDNAVLTVYASDVEAACPGEQPNDGSLWGCTYLLGDQPVMVVPNPCQFADREFLALVMCHELGHANGFQPDHSH